MTFHDTLAALHNSLETIGTTTGDRVDVGGVAIVCMGLGRNHAYGSGFAHYALCGGGVHHVFVDGVEKGQRVSLRAVADALATRAAT